MRSDTVYVTVGTTKFDKLIQTVTKPEVLQRLKNNGYKKIILQIGHGDYIPRKSDIIDLSFYRLKDTISADIQQSGLIISHSGAGSCLEVLSLKKPLIAVINEDLMGNHQMELAKKLSDNNYMYYCSCNNLNHVLQQALPNLNALKPFPDGNIDLFSNYLSKCVGLYTD